MRVDHTTICRWVHTYSPEIDKRTRRYLKPTNDSWRVDETYIKVRGEWKYLYRAVDSEGNTLDFMLSAKRNKIAARRFLKKALEANHNKLPRVINTDKDQAYPLAVNRLKQEKKLKEDSELRRVKYLNNLIEQDHRRVKKIIKAGLGYQSFRTAWKTIRGIEMIQMIRKGQVRNVSKGDSMSQKKFIESLFGIAA
ncbi:MAG: IS6 family transposase [Crocosphaera sp.]